MTNWGWPIGWLFAALFVIAMLRGQLLYWIGRTLTRATLDHTYPRAGWRASAYRWLEGGGANAGIESVRRWGLVAVPFSYLTLGVQSAIQAAAGVLRIPCWHYCVAQIPGALAWAGIYTSFGFVTWAAIGAGIRRYPAPTVTLLLVTLVIGLACAVRRRTFLGG
jgi:membrane protein DedA with SNARE-associated domain